jgi:hypothetical protein
MKTTLFIASLACILSTAQTSWAQYGQDLSKLNTKVAPQTGWRNALEETIYTVDTSINHVDFGKERINRTFPVVFHFKSIEYGKPSFTFTKSQIKRTKMSRNSGISQIELTTEGIQILYKPKKVGPVDDYLVIQTENGDMVFWLTGEILPKKRGGHKETEEKEKAAEAERQPGVKL